MKGAFTGPFAGDLDGALEGPTEAVGERGNGGEDAVLGGEAETGELFGADVGAGFSASLYRSAPAYAR